MGDGLKRAVRAAKRTNYDKGDRARLSLYPKLVAELAAINEMSGSQGLRSTVQLLEQASKIERDSR